MASPQLDEQLMLAMLAQLPDAEDGTRRLRTGAAMLLLDAFDRKATRDQFLAAVGAAIGLIDMLGRYEMINNVKAFYREKGEVTRADIEYTVSQINSQLDTYTDQCTKMAKLFTQCSLDGDKVH